VNRALQHRRLVAENRNYQRTLERQLAKNRRADDYAGGAEQCGARWKLWAALWT
jgi:hypothetical protein